MLDLKRVGVMLRDELPTRPLVSLREAFSRASIEVIEIDGETLDPPPDLVIALGGDGTALRALRAYHHTPILPINFGDVGFLSAGGQEDFEKLIFRLLANDYRIEERVMLHCEFKGTTTEVFNEVVLKGTTKMISAEVYVDDRLIHTIHGDGVIVGTPTGSTSYLLSTGSSIVAPQVQCIIVNGINEHRFASRSLILSPISKIRLRLAEDTHETDMFISHDGQDKIPVEMGDEIAIEKTSAPWRMIQFDSHVFFQNLKTRLDW